MNPVDFVDRCMSQKVGLVICSPTFRFLREASFASLSTLRPKYGDIVKLRNHIKFKDIGMFRSVK